MAINKKKFNKRNKFIKNKNVKKSRKEIRKENRKLKKIKRQEFYLKKTKSSDHDEKKVTEKNNNNTASIEINSVDVLAKQRAKEKKEKRNLEIQMQKQRTKRLLEANESEDKVIKKLEKQLKLDKKKSKSISKTFAGDGLDYILEMCDPETRKAVANARKNLAECDIDAEFEDDLTAVISPNVNTKGYTSLPRRKSTIDFNSHNSDSSTYDYSDYEEDTNRSSNSEVDSTDDESNLRTNNRKSNKKVNKNKQFTSDEDIESALDSEDDTISNRTVNKNKKIEDTETESDSENDRSSNRKVNKNKKLKMNVYSSDSDSNWSENERKSNNKSNEVNSDQSDSSELTPEDATDDEREDVYGRKRDKNGKVIASKNVYVPPALRIEQSDNEKASIVRLKREMKGLMNRVTVGNMISISKQIEYLYNRGDNSRYNLNNTFCDLINEAVVMKVTTPVRTVTDHAVLIAILHANIDIEIGAIYLEKIVEKYDQLLKQSNNATKELDNALQIISVLYNLKVIHCTLIHDILYNLIQNGLTERNLECILVVLRIVGPVLRKDDLVLLKQTIEHIQNTINNASQDVKKTQSSRLKYLASILTSIKNNNFTKIPHYATEDVNLMRQALRNAVHPGNQVTQLNISLDDLLNVKKRGKWWVIGSAWTGVESTKKKSTKDGSDNKEASYNDDLLKLAQKFRMNTDTRRRIFLIIMSALDCDDAYEKLLRLRLAHGQEREIINVLLFCCLHESAFNSFYCVLAQKLCEFSRKYRVNLQCAIWDQIKQLKKWPANKISNLGKFLVQMFLNKSLTLSVLKNVDLSDMDIPLLRFLRVTLCGVLLQEDTDVVTRIWSRVGGTPTFREGLRIFIEQFLLRRNIIEELEPRKKQLLESRAAIASKLLQKECQNEWRM